MTERKKEVPIVETPEQPLMLPIREAAHRSGLSYDAIRKLCLTGKIRYIRCGAKYLINYPLFIRYLNGDDVKTRRYLNGKEVETR